MTTLARAFLLVLPCLLLACTPSAAPTGAGANGGGTQAARPKVVVLRYQIGSDSTEQRERGFLETLAKEFPNIEVVSDEQYAGATREGAIRQAESLLTRFGDEIDGWFCPCEPVTFGTIQAMEAKNLVGKIKVVGFDATPVIVDALRASKVDALVLQDPVTMGYLGVKTAVEKLRGQEPEKRRSTGENLVTRDNMDDANTKHLHAPPLDEWLPKAEAINAGDKKYTIAVIPKGTLHEFWKSIHAGALKAAAELGDVRIKWDGPQREDDKEQQIQIVENNINAKIDAMVIAPLNSKALVDPLERATAAGIPVVVIDSGVETDRVVSFVSTDNYNGGAIAARHLGVLLTEPAAAESPTK